MTASKNLVEERFDCILERVFGQAEPHAASADPADLCAHVFTQLQRFVEPGPLNGCGREDSAAERAFDELLAHRSGQLFNLCESARRVNIRHEVAKRRLARHIAENRIMLLEPHPESGFDGEGHPKLHAIDLGWLAQTLRWHRAEDIMNPKNLGALMETVVVSEWVALFRAHDIEIQMTYWAAGASKEIDIMIEFAGELHAIEVKSTLSPVARHADGIKAWYGRFLRVIPAVVACRVDAPMDLIYGIRAIPWHLNWPGRLA